MINFNFTVDDHDAENLGMILQDNVCNVMAKLTDPNCSEDEKEWVKKHIEYLKALNIKILSSSKKVP